MVDLILYYGGIWIIVAFLVYLIGPFLLSNKYDRKPSVIDRIILIGIVTLGLPITLALVIFAWKG